jgi:serine/threonine protein phosphatase 1
MSSRVIAIGDVHGCADALRLLIEKIDVQPDDTIIPLGDCIDRGPKSKQVIDDLLALSGRCQLVPILGNHEEMMLGYLEGRIQEDDWLECGGAATLASYETAQPTVDVPKEHIEFIRSWHDYYETSSHFFVHASYEPQRPLHEQHWRSLRWHSLRSSVPAMHTSGRTAIVGHTSQKDGEILDLGYLTCIDTYCWGGGWLTALDATTGQVWQADRNGRLRE